MKNSKISYIGKSLFWLSFILGNICLFGYVFSGNSNFALAGYFLLVYASIVNLLAFFGLIVFGLFKQEYKNEAFKSARILLINIPIAILYYFIGISILK
ncbi:hypothetical protein [Epilithonimonas zeae]|uniref:hypothetical protein n=1 Tax=Epilithonimonas zeae TaxID=1416779 RepID=UPI00200ECAAB|nr:hypothetical protein [Epilithonimonas zeae]UQB67339.1 hypothetical protein KI430_09800 [Epilithonimonas zeae]